MSVIEVKHIAHHLVFLLLNYPRIRAFAQQVVDVFFGIVDKLLVARDAINAVEEITDVTDSDPDWCLIF